MSREEQRRRLLLGLEAPLRSLTPDAQARSAMSPRQRRIAALRRSIPDERDFDRRLDLVEQLRTLSAEEAADPGPAPPAPHAPVSGPGHEPARRRRYTVSVPPPAR